MSSIEALVNTRTDIERKLDAIISSSAKYFPPLLLCCVRQLRCCKEFITTSSSSGIIRVCVCAFPLVRPVHSGASTNEAALAARMEIFRKDAQKMATNVHQTSVFARGLSDKVRALDTAQVCLGFFALSLIHGVHLVAVCSNILRCIAVSLGRIAGSRRRSTESQGKMTVGCTSRHTSVDLDSPNILQIARSLAANTVCADC